MLPLARELAGGRTGPRPVPGRSALPAQAPRENHRRPRPCVAAGGRTEVRRSCRIPMLQLERRSVT